MQVCGVSVWLPAEPGFVKHSLHDLLRALERLSLHPPSDNTLYIGQDTLPCHLFILHNGSQGLKSTWQWEHGFCTCGEIPDARASAAPGFSHARKSHQELQHCKISWSACMHHQCGASSSSSVCKRDGKCPQCLAAFPQLGTPSLRISFSYSLCFLARAATCPGLWKRRDLRLLGQNLLAVSVPLS